MENNLDVLQTDAVEPEHLNIGNVNDEIKQEVTEMFDGYKPAKSKASYIEKTDVMKDDDSCSTSQNVRPCNEGDFENKHVEDWLKELIIELCDSRILKPYGRTLQEI